MPTDSIAVFITTLEWTFGKEDHQRQLPCFTLDNLGAVVSAFSFTKRKSEGGTSFRRKVMSSIWDMLYF